MFAQGLDLRTLVSDFSGLGSVKLAIGGEPPPHDSESARQELLLLLASECGLRCSAPAAWTHEWRHPATGTTVRRALDGFLMPRAWHGIIAIVALEHAHVRADHRPVSLQIPERAGSLISFSANVPRTTGWRPHPQEAEVFGRRLLRKFGARPSCAEIQEALAAEAQALDPWEIQRFGRSGALRGRNAWMGRHFPPRPSRTSRGRWVGSGKGCGWAGQCPPPPAMLSCLSPLGQHAVYAALVRRLQGHESGPIAQ